jgi:hypothetical protein
VSDDQKWEIKNLGAGYTVQMVAVLMPPHGMSAEDHQTWVEPRKPEQFCTPREKLGDSPVSVTAYRYPAVLRVEVVDDDKHRGFEYVRLGLGVTRCNGAAH